MAGRRRREGRLPLRGDRRLRLVRGRGQGPHPRPARDDPAPARPRPRAADLPPRRPRLPPDRRPGPGGEGDHGVVRHCRPATMHRVVSVRPAMTWGKACPHVGIERGEVARELADELFDCVAPNHLGARPERDGVEVGSTRTSEMVGRCYLWNAHRNGRHCRAGAMQRDVVRSLTRLRGASFVILLAMGERVECCIPSGIVGDGQNWTAGGHPEDLPLAREFFRLAFAIAVEAQRRAILLALEDSLDPPTRTAGGSWRHGRVKRTRLIQTDRYVVAVEVELVVPPDDPSEPSYEAETVRSSARSANAQRAATRSGWSARQALRRGRGDVRAGGSGRDGIIGHT